MTKKPIISIIVAISKANRGIGKGPSLLWRISDDLKRFKALTLGHPIIMGQTTYESIGKPLPERTNIIVSNDDKYEARGTIVTHSIEESLEKAKEVEENEIFIIGGGQIYKQFLPLVDRLYLTIIEGEREADVFFPEYEKEFTKKISKENRVSPDGIKYSWVILEKE